MALAGETSVEQSHKRALCIWILYDGLWEDVFDYFSDV
jgi:hypothetical protein